MTKNTAVNLGVWAGLIVATAIGMTVMNYSSLPSGSMRSTEGSVIGYVPGEQLSYRYQYTVNGRSFQGSAKPTQRVGDMKLGGRITVFYDEGNPGNSMLAAPRVAIVKRVGLIITVCVAIPFLVMWILQARHILPPFKVFQDCHEWIVHRCKWVAHRFEWVTHRFSRHKAPTKAQRHEAPALQGAKSR